MHIVMSLIIQFKILKSVLDRKAILHLLRQSKPILFSLNYSIMHICVRKLHSIWIR